MHRTLRRPGALAPAVVMAVAITIIAATTAWASSRPVEAELGEVRRATVAYHDVEAAIADGYIPTDDCVEGPGGAMGFHYMHWPRVFDGHLDPTRPEVLLYVPQPDGARRLVGVEYISLTEASLFGQPFEPGPGGSFALHAWIWQANPDGTFAGLNPTLSC